jgi:ornithine cyclodeaminase/alanine dehydrogenase-like protein (mu-crystallin family)
VRGADVVVVATTSVSPVLLGKWLSPRTHINAVGATRPSWRELDEWVLRRSRIYVESREAATRESGDIIAAGKIHAEIGEVIGGQKSGRENSDEITLFKSVGVAVEDVTAADLVWQKMCARKGSGNVNKPMR